MYKIEFSQLSLVKVTEFFRYSKHYYIQKFIDTWLVNGLEIANMYILYFTELENEMTNYINDRLSTWFLWEIENKTSNYEQRKIVLFFKSYTIILTTKKWLNEKVITIEDITIRT